MEKLICVHRRIGFIVITTTMLVACNHEPPNGGVEDGAGREQGLEIDPTLTYAQSMYLEGLEEFVTVHKDPNQVWLERESGEFEDFSVVLEEDRRVYRQKYGAIPHDFYEELAAAEGANTFPVNIIYRSPAAAELTVAGAARDDSEAVAAALATDVQPIVELVESEGLDVRYVAKYMRALAAEGRAEQILALAHDDRVLTVFDARPRDSKELSIHAAVHHEIHSEYGQPLATGSYATGIKVGIIEPNLYDDVNDYSCGVRDDHIAFSGANITYSDPLKLCNPNNPDCGNCGTCFDMGYPAPLRGHCVKSHATQVASLVANTRATGPYAAAEADLYFPNGWDICDGMGGTIQVYDWLIGEGVHTASAAYESCDSYIADTAIRDHDLFIARSSGNTEAQNHMGIACVQSANTLCVGATNSSHGVACYLHWVNPSADMAALLAGIDREEPDVMFVGGDGRNECTETDPNDAVYVANELTTNGWNAYAGTSYAAPTAVALAALLREECGDANNWTDRVLRAIFRTAAHSHNPTGSRYSTPNNQNNDGKDGAGWVAAPDISPFCDPGGDNAGEGIIDLDEGDGTTIDAELGGRPPYEPGNPVENQAPDPAEDWRAFDDPSFNRDYHVIKYLPSVDAGERIRATISWDACPGVIPALFAVPGVDLDLFLLAVDSVNGNHYTGEWVTGSQSVNDNNEGFDYQVPQDGAYLIVAGWPKNDAFGCDLALTEPFGWAWRVLP